MHGMQWWSGEGYFYIHALQGMAGGRGGKKGSGRGCCDMPRWPPLLAMSAAAKENMTHLATIQWWPSAEGLWGCFQRGRRVLQFPAASAGVIGNISPAWFSMGFWLQNTVLTVFLDKATDHCCCVGILRNCFTDCLHWHKILVGLWGFPLPLKMGSSVV